MLVASYTTVKIKVRERERDKSSNEPLVTFHFDNWPFTSAYKRKEKSRIGKASERSMDESIKHQRQLEKTKS